MAETQYTARCHCGKIRFAFVSEEIKTGVRCNCSICVRKGAVMSTKYVPAANFKPHQEMSDFMAYRWNDRVMDHLFCKVCGIYPYHGNDEWGYRVNLGCVEQVEPLLLDIKVIDGKSMAVNANYLDFFSQMHKKE